MTRPYEVEVEQSHSGTYKWQVEVDGEPIAQGHRPQSMSAIEAFSDAKAWVWLHEQLGYPLVKNWWEHLSF